VASVFGEIGIVGTAAAIANTAYHATGIRLRELPLTPEKFFSGESPPGAASAVP
jgi:xanthine dehydrogenase YagR molybdenum-binding subunit